MKYNPDMSNIDVLKDVSSLLNQLSECYNSKIKDLQDKIAGLQAERIAMSRAVKNKDWKTLQWYFGYE